uniref:Polynucleotidyl transferase, ribonuclease H-like superfamily protein n=1 Tax=Tanacetum cinerariifolium TaxID=118510 RepID=A0A6L2MB91_TANCI|nr:polynucleotidyl transferase, ribonuclease H-like superfamily protein [Tanacetum cinerariifolium]
MWGMVVTLSFGTTVGHLRSRFQIWQSLISLLKIKTKQSKPIVTQLEMVTGSGMNYLPFLSNSLKVISSHYKWRNMKIFGRDEGKPIDPIRFLHTKLKEMSDALLKDDMQKQGYYKIRKEVFIGWVTPPDGWVMLNTDEASRGNPRVEFYEMTKDASFVTC